MNNVQQVALERAVALLFAAKVDFAVVLPDGSKQGNLIVVPPKKEKERKTNRTVKFRWDKDFGYIKRIEQLQPGDMIEFVVPSDGAVHFRGAVSGTCSRRHGAGNCIVATEWIEDGAKMKVEVLRVS